MRTLSSLLTSLFLCVPMLSQYMSVNTSVNPAPPSCLAVCWRLSSHKQQAGYRHRGCQQGRVQVPLGCVGTASESCGYVVRDRGGCSIAASPTRRIYQRQYLVLAFVECSKYANKDNFDHRAPGNLRGLETEVARRSEVYQGKILLLVAAESYTLVQHWDTGYSQALLKHFR